MKKALLILLIIFTFGVLCLAAQEADVVVLMDTSGTLLPWFDQINSRVLPDITEKFIRKGDTFHLISFNSRVNLELVQPIENEADISRIVSRFMLLYPLGKNSDFLSGLKYTWQYISGLNQQRQKIIIVISDGIFNPPESSPYASYTLQQAQEEVAQSARRIRGAGWNVYYIKLPYPEDVAILSLDGDFVTETRGGENAGTAPGTIAAVPQVDSGGAAEESQPAVPATDSPATAAGGAEETGRQDVRPTQNPSDSGGSVSAGQPARGEVAANVTQNPPPHAMPDAGNTDAPRVSPDTPISDTPENSYYDISKEFIDELDIQQTVLPEDEDAPLEFTDSVFHLPKITVPENLGKQARHFTLPLGVENPAAYEVNMQLTRIVAGEYGDILEKSVFLNLAPGKKGTIKAPLVLPETVDGRFLEIPFELRFSDNLRVDPQTGIIRMELVDMTAESFFKTRGIVILTVFLILFAIVALIALILFISNRTNKPVAEINKAARSSPGATARPANAAAAKPVESRAAFYPSSADHSAADAASGTKSGEKESRQYIPAAAYAQDPSSYEAKERSREDVIASFALETDPAVRKGGGKTSSAAGVGLSASVLDNQLKTNADDNRAKYTVLGSKSDGVPVRRDVSFDMLHHKTTKTQPSILVSDSDGKIMLNLFVENQNTNIGKRNVHQMRNGAKLSIGGGSSPFLIFLVKFPANIAEVRYNGSTCSLAILKPEYFPYEKSPVINDCIDRPITAVSEKGYPVTFMIRQFEDPVVTLNRLLNSINE